MALRVFITSRKERIFDGTCHTLTSHNEIGEFDILEQHAHFITLIDKYVVMDKGTVNELKIDLERGVIKCFGDKVDVFVSA